MPYIPLNSRASRSTKDANFDAMHKEASAVIDNFENVSTIFGGSAHPVNTPQVIPVRKWTPVIWENVPLNSSNVILQPDKMTWRRLNGDKKASGLFMTIASVAWENTDVNLLRPHRRRIRLVNASASFYMWLPLVENECATFHPDIPDKEELSYGMCAMMDGYDHVQLQKEADADMRIEVWHNAEVPIRIVPENLQGPLLMSTKLTEYTAFKV